MSLRLIIRPEAEADIRETIQWYEEKRSGLGWQFAEETGKSIRRALGNPRAYRLMRRQPHVRRILTRRFPCLIFYLLREDAWRYSPSFMESGRKRIGLSEFEVRILPRLSVLAPTSVA